MSPVITSSNAGLGSCQCDQEGWVCRTAFGRRPQVLDGGHFPPPSTGIGCVDTFATIRRTSSPCGILNVRQFKVCTEMFQGRLRLLVYRYYCEMFCTELVNAELYYVQGSVAPMTPGTPHNVRAIYTVYHNL